MHAQKRYSKHADNLKSDLVLSKIIKIGATRGADRVQAIMHTRSRKMYEWHPFAATTRNLSNSTYPGY